MDVHPVDAWSGTPPYEQLRPRSPPGWPSGRAGARHPAADRARAGGRAAASRSTPSPGSTASSRPTASWSPRAGAARSSPPRPRPGRARPGGPLTSTPPPSGASASALPRGPQDARPSLVRPLIWRPAGTGGRGRPRRLVTRRVGPAALCCQTRSGSLLPAARHDPAVRALRPRLPVAQCSRRIMAVPPCRPCGSPRGTSCLTPRLTRCASPTRAIIGTERAPVDSGVPGQALSPPRVRVVGTFPRRPHDRPRPDPRQGPQAAGPGRGPGGDRARSRHLHRQGNPAHRRLRHRPAPSWRRQTPPPTRWATAC